jgi:hypothetical protein
VSFYGEINKKTKPLPQHRRLHEMALPYATNFAIFFQMHNKFFPLAAGKKNGKFLPTLLPSVLCCMTNRYGKKCNDFLRRFYGVFYACSDNF